MQSSVILSPNVWGVGLNETFLPQYLKSEGYVNHGIGKVRTEKYSGFCVFWCMNCKQGIPIWPFKPQL